MALVAPQTLAAKPDQCASVKTLLAGQAPELLKDLAVTFNADGGVDVTLDGRTDLFTNATGCSINSPSQYLELSCSWDFDEDLFEARKKLSLLRIQLNDCLPSPLAQDKTYVSSVDGLEVPFVYESSIEYPDDEQLDISLKMYRFFGDDRSDTYHVDISFSR